MRELVKEEKRMERYAIIIRPNEDFIGLTKEAAENIVEKWG